MSSNLADTGNPEALAQFDSTFRAKYQQMLAYLPKGIFSYPPLPPYFTGYEQGTLWDWDQYFEAIIQLYAGFPTDYIINAIKIYLSRQLESGHIHRSVPRGGGETYHKHTPHWKPFMAQEIVMLLQTGDTLDWLKKEDRYERLKKYLVYWLINRDVRGAGLSVWEEAGHTGMDNHYERAGQWGGETAFCEGVDLNAYLVRECQAMSVIAKCFGHSEDKEFFEQAGADRAAAIQRDLWHEEDGIYYDFHAIKKEPINLKYVGAFLPLWSGVPTEAQAKRLVNEHLLNENEFWRPFPIPAIAATEPGYVEGFLPGHSVHCCSWRAHTWLPTNYMVFHGLRNYGYDNVAGDLADRTWEMFMRGEFSEYYMSESGVGTGRKPFWGWTCLALFMKYELEMRSDPTVLAEDNDAVAQMRERVRKVAM
jgi:glycogen debranching enzyme